MKSDCVDRSDEAKCAFRPNVVQSSAIPPPAQVDFNGLGNFTVTALNTSSCPETHFQCPPDGYCLPDYVRCNGVYDCPGGVDEADCDHFHCRNFYRCRGSRVCVHQKHMCDGVFQCPQHDDELLCNFTCPDTCTCYGLAFVCSGPVLLGSLYPDLKYLDASGTNMKPRDLVNNTLLVYLSLRNCKIKSIRDIDLPSLQTLDLSYNQLTVLDRESIHRLGNLRHLILAFNYGMSLNISTSDTLIKILSLDVSGLSIPYLNETFLSTFPRVVTLNLSHTGLQMLHKSGFQRLNKMKLLDLRGCPLDTFYKGVFDGLYNLERVYTDNYKLCCSENLPSSMNADNCFAESDKVSSCTNLLRYDIFRVFLALYAVFTVVGNLGGFLYRIFYVKGAIKMGYEIFVTHLSVADFLMGVYLSIVGIADRWYYGDYQWNDVAWKRSVSCKMAGFLSLLSSEVSALLICIITLERFLVIGFPLSHIRFSMLAAHATSAVLWLVGIFLAIIPLLMPGWDFYGQSGICIPLPISVNRFRGSDYSFGIMIVFNFLLFVIVAVGQLLIYRAFKVHTHVSKDTKKDMAVARRLLAVVLTDFLCWFPIGLLGIMARSGVSVSADVDVVIAILVLPLNSALNPFLYTFHVMMDKRRQRLEQTTRSMIEKEYQSITRSAPRDTNYSVASNEPKVHTKEEAFSLFGQFLDDGLLSPKLVRRKIWNIYEGDQND